MIKKETYIESVSRKKVEKERMLKYSIFAKAFSYPDASFKQDLSSIYDKLFRAKEIWLYTTEHLAKNEFQRSNYLSDIMGFYKAFGVEPDKDRPDSLSAELEFMHYLIFKVIYALNKKDAKDTKEKCLICVDAQKKFFAEHLYPGAKKIAKKIISDDKKGFYGEKANELLEFLESEKRFLEESV